MSEVDMEDVLLEVRLPKGHEPVWVLLISATPVPDDEGEEQLAVTPQWQPLAARIMERSEDGGRVVLAISAVANRGLANMIAVFLEANPVDAGDSWQPTPSRDQRMPPGVGG